MNRRLAAVLTPLLALGLAACTGSGSAEPEAAKTLDPRDALVASTEGMLGGNYKFTIDSPDETGMSGLVDATAKSLALELKSASEGTEMTMNFLVIDPTRYVKIEMDMGETAEQLKSLEGLDVSDPEIKETVETLKTLVDTFSGKTWMKIDMTKIKSDDFNLDATQPDVIGLTPLLSASTTAERSGNTITGTLDLSTVQTKDDFFSATMLDGIDPAAAKAVPYQVTVDDKGRLTKATFDLPKTTDTPAGKWTIGVDGYGTVEKMTAPVNNNVVDAPDTVYDMMNGETA